MLSLANVPIVEVLSHFHQFENSLNFQNLPNESVSSDAIYFSRTAPAVSQSTSSEPPVLALAVAPKKSTRKTSFLMHQANNVLISGPIGSQEKSPQLTSSSEVPTQLTILSEVPTQLTIPSEAPTQLNVQPVNHGNVQVISSVPMTTSGSSRMPASSLPALIFLEDSTLPVIKPVDPAEVQLSSSSPLNCFEFSPALVSSPPEMISTLASSCIRQGSASASSSAARLRTPSTNHLAIASPAVARIRMNSPFCVQRPENTCPAATLFHLHPPLTSTFEIPELVGNI